MDTLIKKLHLFSKNDFNMQTHINTLNILVTTKLVFVVYYLEIYNTIEIEKF